jgi:hypothetical protein
VPEIAGKIYSFGVIRVRYLLAVFCMFAMWEQTCVQDGSKPVEKLIFWDQLISDHTHRPLILGSSSLKGDSDIH